MKSRKFLVSDEDAALFREAMRGAKPLQKRALAPAAENHRKIFVPVASHSVRSFVETDSAAPPIRGHREARLRRGRLEPEARIDLHGFSYEAAYRSLIAFLARAFTEGRTLVLVITGKGGVLRPHLPLWLNGPDLRDLVIGTREAHPRHGGAGAFYVALHRRNPGVRK